MASTLIASGGCRRSPPRVLAAASLELAGLSNVRRLNEGLLTGGMPVGERGLRSLAGQGIRTIISVDAALPDAAGARKLGMRYVHLPISYGRVPYDRAVEISRAVRDLPGPVYIHCHHGRHRAPTAAALALRSIARWPADAAIEMMRAAGTSPKYQALYASVRKFRPPSRSRLDDADDSFPEAAAVPALALGMSTLADHWALMEAIRDANWKTPAAHPDLMPAHQALLIRESFREMARLDDVAEEPDDFRNRLAASEHLAAALEQALRESKPKAAKIRYEQLDKACAACHDNYRDSE